MKGILDFIVKNKLFAKENDNQARNFLSWYKTVAHLVSLPTSVSSWDGPSQEHPNLPCSSWGNSCFLGYSGTAGEAGQGDTQELHK